MICRVTLKFSSNQQYTNLRGISTSSSAKGKDRSFGSSFLQTFYLLLGPFQLIERAVQVFLISMASIICVAGLWEVI